MRNPKLETRLARLACALVALLVVAVLVRMIGHGLAQDLPRDRPSEAAVEPGGIDPALVDRELASWPRRPREVARRLIEKYGYPREFTPLQAVWHRNGPWRRTILSREEVPHHWPARHIDLLEQEIDYKADPERYDELGRFDGSVIVERTRGTIAARSDREEMNFLALNLAHDVATGRKSVEEARRHYEAAALAGPDGPRDRYLEKLHFDVPRGDTGDPDRPAAPAAD